MFTCLLKAIENVISLINENTSVENQVCGETKQRNIKINTKKCKIQKHKNSCQKLHKPIAKSIRNTEMGRDETKKSD